MIFFQNILDIAAYNAAVIFFSVNPDFDTGEPQRRRLFLEKLAMDMIDDCIQNRAHGKSQAIQALLPLHEDAGGPRKRVRYSLCPRQTDRKLWKNVVPELLRSTPSLVLCCA